MLVNEWVIGSVFNAKGLSEMQLDRFSAVIPQVEGTFFCLRFANWFVDSRDSLGNAILAR